MKKSVLLLNLLCSLLLFNIQDTLSQNNNVDPNYYDRATANYSTPQAWAFQHYGDVNTNYYTGTMTQEIPVYTIKDEDFNLHISLRYISDAFKPAKHSELCGYNWYINAGGCITREVRGFPDDEELHDHYYGHDFYAYRLGYLPYVRNERQIKPNQLISFTDFTAFSNNDVAAFKTWHDDFHLFFPKMGTQNSDKHCLVDYMPDIYHFNFCGYTGTFTLNYKGDPIIIDGDFVNIDVSNLGYQSIMSIDKIRLANLRAMKSICPKPTSITITTKDGYKYIFGGNNAALEYNFNVNFFLLSNTMQARQTAQTDIPPITSWYLTSIIAPNNRKIEFTYKKRNDRTWQFDEHFSLNQCRYNKRQVVQLVDNIYNYDYKLMSLSATKMAILDNISLDNLQIKFNYDVCKSPLYPRLQTVNGKFISNDIFNAYQALIEEERYIDDVRYNNSKEDYEEITGENYPYQLMSIEVVCGKTIIKNCKLSYRNYTSQNTSEHQSKINNWSFLEQVKINDETYEMEYDIDNNPAKINVGYYPTDPYGNSTISEPTKVWLINQDNRGYIATSSKENFALFGTLKKITFPTGGYQTFAYDKQHRCDHRYNYQYKIDKLDDDLNPFMPWGNTNEWLNGYIRLPYHYIVYPYNSYNKYSFVDLGPGYITGTPITAISTYDKNDQLLQKKIINYYNGVYHDNVVRIKWGNRTYITMQEYVHYTQLVSDIGYLNVNIKTTDYSADKNTTFTENLTFLSDNPCFFLPWNNELSLYPVEKINFDCFEDIPLFVITPSSEGCINSWSFDEIYEGHYYATDNNKNHFNSIFFDVPYISPRGGRLSYRMVTTNNLNLRYEEYTWGDIKQSPDSLAVYNWDIHRAIARLYYINPIVLKQQKITEYTPNGQTITTTTSYTYDEKHRVKTTTIKNNEQELTKQYTYPDQIQQSYTDFVDKNGNKGSTCNPLPRGIIYLIYNNMINEPVETITLSNGKIVDGKICLTDVAEKNKATVVKAAVGSTTQLYPQNYTNTEKVPASQVEKFGIDIDPNKLTTSFDPNTSIFVPYYPLNYNKTKKVYDLQLETPLSPNKYKQIRGETIDPNYKLTCVYDFDQNNRLVKITPTGQIPTYLTWTNNYITQIKKGDIITKYTYLPFIGISSITDERGITTYYAYDNLGRLKEIYQIRNGKKEILQAYSYHYNNQ